MKVSILTYHEEDNYGATLQAYATYKAVAELGFTPEIINLHMTHKKRLLSSFLFSLKRYRFNSFRRKVFRNSTKIYHSVEDLRADPPQSDMYLVGSDQTWNPTISGADALAFFLDFGSKNIKRASYASSFGHEIWEDTVFATKETVKRLLSRFSTILVRESDAVELLRREFGLQSTQVLDPVLLSPSYFELTGEIHEKADLVVYKIKPDDVFYSKAVQVGHCLSCKVYSLGSLRQPRGIHTHYPERIERWISNIGSAKYVFTDSFHGTVLSLLYHRQFVVYIGDEKKMSRLTSLLKLFNLEGRICAKSDGIDLITRIFKDPIDYSVVDKILDKERVKSLMLLKEAIEK